MLYFFPILTLHILLCTLNHLRIASNTDPAVNAVEILVMLHCLGDNPKETESFLQQYF